MAARHPAIPRRVPGSRASGGLTYSASGWSIGSIWNMACSVVELPWITS
jgi:hypothetical protein